ncbi:MAG: hypothetical protein HOM34_07160 [Planctomycetes bacterium]|jgi:hypothetical protein|nr:hypothetical protein [Planctomycetota bacterium]MBT4029426.1 hypothetical protein [Planctomycetota bacterium]MBT4559969.1 hypothetical protein [Planctomycetota bacterium]MBT5120482.1 hypothetical protein [Planctomycetota bacterium]MBT7011804.1 hypothetical protein [Planctomycetota bacterium]
MSRSNRGAAQVSLMWVIALAVISLVAFLFAFMSQQKLVDVQVVNDALRAETAEAKALFEVESDKGLKISKSVGYQGADGSMTSVDTVKAATTELQAVFALEGNLRDLSAAVPGVIGKYNALTRERDAFKTEVAQLRNDLDARQASFQTALSDKDGQLRDARREGEDALASLNNQLLNLERERDGLREQYQDLDRSAANERSAHADAIVAKDRDYAVMKQRNDIVNNRLNQLVGRQEVSDGSILVAEASLSKAWIDKGRMARVRPGLEFEVRNPLSGAVKGRIRVLSVEEVRAEVAILATTDKYDPIRSNDAIFNPIYDAGRSPIAVLLGDGFGRYSKGDLTAMLGEIGVEVRDDLTVESDYLLLGTPFFDEDSGDMLSWEAHDSYKTAKALSVKVVASRDWMIWLGQ